VASVPEIVAAVLARQEIDLDEVRFLRAQVPVIADAVRKGEPVSAEGIHLLRAAAGVGNFGTTGKTAREYDAGEKEFLCIGLKHPKTGQTIGPETALDSLEHHLLKRIDYGWPDDMRPYDYLTLAQDVVLSSTSKGYTAIEGGSGDPILLAIAPTPPSLVGLGPGLLVMYTLVERRFKTLYDTAGLHLNTKTFAKVVQRW
jgi:hypothetical protein